MQMHLGKPWYRSNNDVFNPRLRRRRNRHRITVATQTGCDPDDVNVFDCRWVLCDPPVWSNLCCHPYASFPGLLNSGRPQMACRRVSDAKINLDLACNRIARLKVVHATKTATHRRSDEEKTFRSSDNPAVRGIENHGNSD